jgi:hypothetical protein
MPTIDELQVTAATHLLIRLHQYERVVHDNVWREVWIMQECDSLRRLIAWSLGGN